MVSGFLAITIKLMEAPTAIKNSPSSKFLKGSRVLSSSCLNSLLDSTTPPKNAPSAGLSPTYSIKKEIENTISKAEAMSNSRTPVFATLRSMGTIKNLPTTIIRTTERIIASV